MVGDPLDARDAERPAAAGWRLGWSESGLPTPDLMRQLDLAEYAGWV